MEKVVIHFKSGNILKGLTPESLLMDGRCAVIPDKDDSELSLLVSVERAKGIFFVKSFEGAPLHAERRRFPRDEMASARKTIVHFHDGEILYGYTALDGPPREAFWMVPCDAASNNERILIHPSSLRDIKILLPSGALS